jgi:hypothetical protein
LSDISIVIAGNYRGEERAEHAFKDNSRRRPQQMRQSSHFDMGQLRGKEEKKETGCCLKLTNGE